jgi:hypothetical protein
MIFILDEENPYLKQMKEKVKEKKKRLQFAGMRNRSSS